MSSYIRKSFNFPSLLGAQSIVYAGIAWAVLALLFYLLFSTPIPGEERPFWYSIGTYIFEQVPFLVAAILCFRNWQNPHIASGNRVWLGIGLGMISFFIGNLLFGLWELYWGLDPDVSPGDFFFIGFYLFLGWGMFLATIGRRLTLEVWQWVAVGAIAIAGIVLALWLSLPTAAAPQASNRLTITSIPQMLSPVAVAQAQAPPQTAPAVAPPPKSPAPAATQENQPPGWVLSLQQFLEPLAGALGLFYIVCDVLLLIISAVLFLGYWGGRLAQSWRMIAAASFCFYIADMWFKYATDRIGDYQSGFLLEVFWVFSGVLFAMGAALEYENSMRSRRGGRKRA